MTTVAIIDDDSNSLKLIELYLKPSPEIRVVGSFLSGPTFLESAAELGADVVLIDHRLPGDDGIEVGIALKKIVPMSKVIVLTGYDSPGLAERAMLAGLEGYILKDDAPRDRIPAAVLRVNAGEKALTPKSLSHIIERFRFKSDCWDSLWPKLTPQESIVLEQRTQGRSQKEIADRMGLSENTVENHIRRIRGKSAPDLTFEGIITCRSALRN